MENSLAAEPGFVPGCELNLFSFHLVGKTIVSSLGYWSLSTAKSFAELSSVAKIPINQLNLKPAKLSWYLSCSNARTLTLSEKE